MKRKKSCVQFNKDKIVRSVLLIVGVNINLTTSSVSFYVANVTTFIHTFENWQQNLSFFLLLVPCQVLKFNHASCVYKYFSNFSTVYEAFRGRQNPSLKLKMSHNSIAMFRVSAIEKSVVENNCDRFWGGQNLSLKNWTFCVQKHF